MGLISFFVGIGTAIVGALSVAASYVGSAVAAMAVKLVSLAPVIGEYISKIAIIVDFIGKIFGVTVEDTPEELGYKASIAEKGIDDFDSTKEYMQYLEKDIKIDEEEYSKRSDEKRLADMTIGSVLVVKGISEEKEIDISEEFLIEVAKQDLTGTQVATLIETYKEREAKLDIYDYLQGNIHGIESIESGETFAAALRKLYPKLTPDAIDDKIIEMKRTSVSFEEGK